jgi:hypothetical protein
MVLLKLEFRLYYNNISILDQLLKLKLNCLQLVAVANRLLSLDPTNYAI